MKIKYFIFPVLLIILLTPSLSQAQRRKIKSGQKTAISGKAAASWKTFFPFFTDAVKKQNSDYLRKIMVKDFSFDFGYDADRDEALRFISKASYDLNDKGKGRTGWKVLQEILRKGIEPDLENMREGGKRPAYIAPLKSGTGCRTSWEFYDNSWHWMYFVCGD